MPLKIPAPELDRIVQNALLYADEKAMRLNEVLFTSNPGYLGVYSCDDYVVVHDYCSADSPLRDFALSVSNTKDLGDWIKKDKKVVHKYDITIRSKMTGMIFECDEVPYEDSDEESPGLFFSDSPTNWDSWKLVFELLNEDNMPRVIPDFAIRPERLAKLARLKADKEAPIHMRGIDINNHLIIQFKKGLTLTGAIMPVDQSYVKEEFLWDQIEA